MTFPILHFDALYFVKVNMSLIVIIMNIQFVWFCSHKYEFICDVLEIKVVCMISVWFDSYICFIFEFYF